jgi:cysteine-S-conjugate beta-lyase
MGITKKDTKLDRRFFMKGVGAAALFSGINVSTSNAIAGGMGHTSMSMTYNLNEDFNRIGSGDFKWDAIRRGARPHDVKWPMGVADMDFRALPEITAALQKRMNHENWGYEGAPADYLDNIVAWNKKRYNQDVPKDNIINCLGVLDGVLSVLKVFNPNNAKVLIHTPGYSGFFSVIKQAGFGEIENELKLVNGRYEMDFDLMERQLGNDIKILLFCNPQNPTGNCWTADEMRKMGDICNRKGVLVIADEIHCDFVNKQAKYIPYASLGEKYAMNSFTVKSASKSFNLAAHRTAYMFSDNTDYIKRVVDGGHHRELLHTMGTIACNAAYKHGAQYMDDVQSYIDSNCHFLAKFCAEKMPLVKYTVQEGTYLAWLDCSELAKKLGKPAEGQRVGDVIKDFFIQKASVNINPGESYGKNGVGYMRMNLGTTHQKLHQALNSMAAAIDAL